MTEQGVRFGDTKIFAVPESMDDLRGPAEGPVTLSAWGLLGPGRFHVRCGHAPGR